MSYPVSRKNLGDDAENNTVVALPRTVIIYEASVLHQKQEICV